MKSTHSLAVCLLFVVHCVYTENSKCATPNSLEGECINIDDCAPILSLRDSEHLTTENITYLRQSQCGFSDVQSKVCCPISNKTRPFQLPTGHINRTRPQEVMPTYNRFKPNDGLPSRFKPSEGLPQLGVCGRQLFDNKIFDGVVTAIDEFPWMALLEYQRKHPLNGHGFACGGALINERYVMTAAHCASGKNEQALGGLINVRLGEHNLDKERDCDAIYQDDCADPPVDVGIEKKIIHPDYDEDNIDQLHDIALLKLTRSVTYNDFIKPICLSKDLPDIAHQAGHNQFVAGWGQTEFGRSSPVKLKLKVPLVDDKKCANKYKGLGIRLGSKQICAGGIRRKDSCTGDSGGPLMVQVVSESTGVSWYATGIVSIGPLPCATKGIPGIYTKVVDYIDWILENIKT